MEPAAGQVRNRNTQKNKQAHIQRAHPFKKTANHCSSITVGPTTLPSRFLLEMTNHAIGTLNYRLWERLGAFWSWQMRIPRWSNVRVDWIDAVASSSARKHLDVPATSMGLPTTSLEAGQSTGHQPGSTSNHSRAVCEKQHLLWEHRRGTCQS